MITSFLPDRPGILAHTLAVFDNGVTVPLLGQERIRWSIEGSMTSAIHGTFVMAFIVRPISPDGAASEIWGESLATQGILQLKDSLENALVQFDVWPENSQNERRELVDIIEFHGLPDSLFSERRFTEYRFGVPEHRSADLANVLQSFTQVLKTHKVPIAYLYFPEGHSNREGGADSVWLRVGVGAAPALVDSVDLDLATIRIARACRASFSKYDPVREGALSDRFRVISDSSHAAAGAVGAEVPTAVEVVFSAAEGRVGLVADMIGRGVGNKVVGGSMAVLGGHTLACWVVPDGDGETLAAAISSVITATSGSSLETGKPLVRRVNASITKGDSAFTVWVAWQHPDGPGVMRRLVDACRDLSEKMYRTPNAIDFRYTVSRVLQDPDLGCAGKMKFVVDPGSAGNGDQFRTELKKRCDGLWSSAVRRSDSELDPARCVVLVLACEPGEEPWASLILP